ncbi:MAG: hypothetical protein ACFFD4_40455 [Candidatus Odinarchaeota archaeon]
MPGSGQYVLFSDYPDTFEPVIRFFDSCVAIFRDMHCLDVHGPEERP